MRLIGLFLALSLLAPLAAEAQTAGKPARLGYLSLGSRETAALVPLRLAFIDGLRGLGYVERYNVVIEYQFAAGDRDQLAGRAQQLARLQPDVLIGEGFEAADALKRATVAVPIVMVACDAEAGGLIESLARPGGNVTGITCITSELGAKRLELLREIAPRISRIAVLWNSGDPAKRLELDGISAAARARGVSVHPLDVRISEDLDRAFAAARRERVAALLVLGDAFTMIHRSRITNLAAQTGLPVMYSFRQFVDAGGLMSYGPNAEELSRRLALYVDKVLKGAKPADLPAHRTTHQIRAGHQPEDRQGPRAHDSTFTAAAGRPGDRVNVLDQCGQLLLVTLVGKPSHRFRGRRAGYIAPLLPVRARCRRRPGCSGRADRIGCTVESADETPTLGWPGREAAQRWLK
jgi:ABC-type uncharacterized transport system substrate-binding protein